MCNSSSPLATRGSRKLVAARHRRFGRLWTGRPPPRAPCWPAGFLSVLAGACQFGTAWAGLRLIHHHHHDGGLDGADVLLLWLGAAYEQVPVGGAAVGSGQAGSQGTRGGRGAPQEGNGWRAGTSEVFTSSSSSRPSSRSTTMTRSFDIPGTRRRSLAAPRSRWGSSPRLRGEQRAPSCASRTCGSAERVSPRASDSRSSSTRSPSLGAGVGGVCDGKCAWRHASALYFRSARLSVGFTCGLG